jgi:hypothetical protein
MNTISFFFFFFFFFFLVTAWPTAPSSAEFDRIFGATNVELNREAWLSLFGTSAKRDS